MRHALLALAALAGCSVPAGWGADALVKPAHRPSSGAPAGAEPFTIEAAPGVNLRGWLARGVGRRRGLIVYLHGVGDNKDSAAGLAARYAPLGWDVAAYDARAHGESGGDYCTYGFYEKRDVARVLTALAASGADAEHTILFGASMGAAVALQAAPLDGRVRAVVAVAPFADLESAARAMKPFFMSQSSFAAARAAAEERAAFRVAEVAPVRAVEALHVPLLLVHGTADRKLSVENSRRLWAAAATPDKTLIEVPGAGHDDVLARAAAWDAIDRFIGRLIDRAKR